MNAVALGLAELAIIEKQVKGVDSAACEAMIDEIRKAKRIFVGGAGRSLLAMKMFAMRLMQTNHAAFLVGEVCTPGIGPGDLLVVGSGGGETGSTLEVVRKAKRNGARAALLTGNPGGSIAAEADIILPIPPADGMAASDPPETAFVKANQPGNLYETASLIVMDGLISRIMEREGLTGEVVFRNHANLE